MRFWDSSALVPLVVLEAASKQAEAWLGEDPTMLVWTLSSVEVLSALERLRRNGTLSRRDVTQAELVSRELLASAHTITDTERVKAGALRLLRVHPLRAADSLQLAAALVAVDGAPVDQVFHTFDRRLGVAAAAEGFRVVPEPE